MIGRKLRAFGTRTEIATYVAELQEILVSKLVLNIPKIAT